MITKYNTTGRRFWAGFIDALIILSLNAILVHLFFNNNSIFSQFVCIIYYNFFAVAYTILLHGFYGQTIGKRVMKVTVLDITEKKITMKQACWRETFYIFTSLIYLPINMYFLFSEAVINEQFSTFLDVLNNSHLIWFAIEIVSCLTNEKRRAIHDYIAGTVVINNEFLEKG